MNLKSGVQIMVETDCVSLQHNTLGKGVNPLLPAIGTSRARLKLFILSKPTDPGERKIFQI